MLVVVVVTGAAAFVDFLETFPAEMGAASTSRKTKLVFGGFGIGGKWDLLDVRTSVHFSDSGSTARTALDFPFYELGGEGWVDVIVTAYSFVGERAALGTHLSRAFWTAGVDLDFWYRWRLS